MEIPPLEEDDNDNEGDTATPPLPLKLKRKRSSSELSLFLPSSSDDERPITKRLRTTRGITFVSSFKQDT
jgi:hypothetical protein